MADRVMCPELKHRYFVAETVGIESDGVVCVILVCTLCGAPLMHKFRVSDRGSRLTMPPKKEKGE